MQLDVFRARRTEWVLKSQQVTGFFGESDNLPFLWTDIGVFVAHLCLRIRMLMCQCGGMSGNKNRMLD
jgi:hypothetical protein